MPEEELGAAWRPLRAIPKSASFAIPRPRGSDAKSTRMLPGLMSLWTIPPAMDMGQARAISVIQAAVCSGGGGIILQEPTQVLAAYQLHHDEAAAYLAAGAWRVPPRVEDPDDIPVPQPSMDFQLPPKGGVVRGVR